MSRSHRSLRLAIREVRSFLHSPVGWIILASFFGIAAWVFLSVLGIFHQSALSFAQRSQIRPSEVGLHVNDFVIRPYLFNLGSILLIFIPLLTMRSIAEERRTGSLELLFSYPLRASEIITGKFLGAALSLAALFCVLPLHGLILGAVSEVDWGASLVGVLGLVLLGFFMISLGILISSLSNSQIEAGVLTLGVLLLLGLGPGVAEAASPNLARVLGFLAVLDRFEDFTRGVLELRHVAFFLGGTVLWLALAVRSLDLLRWRGA